MLESSPLVKLRSPVLGLREIESRLMLTVKQSKLLARVASFVDREAERAARASSNQACLICRESFDQYAGLEAMDDFSVQTLFEVYAELTNSTRPPGQNEKWCRNCCEILAGGSRALERARYG